MMNDIEFGSIDDLCRSALGVFRPPPNITVSEWADKYRRLSQESSARPGKFRTEVVEYLREPMNMVGAPGVSRISLMTSAQVGKSTFIENVIGYHIHLDPCPILHVSPTLESQKMFSKERLSPMIRDTKELSGLVKAARARDSDNTLGVKKFPGGFIAMVGSNAPAGLASRPVRIVLADEVDRFEASAGSEGDPLSLAVKRTTTFWNRVIIFVTTPGNKGESRIDEEFRRGDMRYYHAECPHCGEKQRLKWSNVQWEDDDPDSAVYICEKNGCVWDDNDRNKAVRNGEWIASRPFNGNVSYHLSQLYSPFAPLADGVRDFLDAKDNPQLLKTWVNTFLGETWEEKGKRLEWSYLRKHRSDYETTDQIPEEVTVITAAVDVQDDRFEVEIVGWGVGHKTWSLKYEKIYGDLSADQIWLDLSECLNQSFVHPLFGEMAIRSTCIDSGGHYTESVYRYCSMRPRTMAIKGMGGAGKPMIMNPTTKTIGGYTLYPLGVDTIKEVVVARLKIEDPDQPGYCHFPNTKRSDEKSPIYDDDYFRGLTAEEVRTKFIKGFKFSEWHKIRPRNEPFDLRVYGTAALEMLSLDLKGYRMSLMKSHKEKDMQERAKKVRRPKKARKSSFAESWKND